jgi:hypothetical protein
VTCSVIYYEENSKTPHIQAFGTIEEAKNFLSSPRDKYQSKILNAQIMVSYDVIDSYVEMFNLMKKGIFGNYDQKKVFIDEEENDDRKNS